MLPLARCASPKRLIADDGAIKAKQTRSSQKGSRVARRPTMGMDPSLEAMSQLRAPVRRAAAGRATPLATLLRGYPGVTRWRALDRSQFDAPLPEAYRRCCGNGRELTPDAYRNEMAALGRASREGLTNLPGISAVVYPMAGDDATLPMHLFPEANEIVLIDAHPFAHPGVFEGAPIVQRRCPPTAWVNFRDLDGEVYMARGIIPAILSQLPGARINSVEVLETSRWDACNRLYRPDGLERVTTPDGDTISVPACHGILTVSLPSGEQKTIIHLNTFVPRFDKGARPADFTNPWWLDLLARVQPRGIVVKGSQSLLKPTETDSPFTDLALAWVKNGGVVVEGLAHEGDTFELLPDEALRPPATSRVFLGSYGYGAPPRARITWFPLKNAVGLRAPEAKVGNAELRASP